MNLLPPRAIRSAGAFAGYKLEIKLIILDLIRPLASRVHEPCIKLLSLIKIIFDLLYPLKNLEKCSCSCAAITGPSSISLFEQLIVEIADG